MAKSSVRADSRKYWLPTRAGQWGKFENPRRIYRVSGMISVIVYGRNDAHGYNLHKRAAISLNCIAEMLSHAGDEILFVDYNTPNDLPTFIEAIYDTLTSKAKSLLRVFRVRPE